MKRRLRRRKDNTQRVNYVAPRRKPTLKERILSEPLPRRAVPKMRLLEVKPLTPSTIRQRHSSRVIRRASSRYTPVVITSKLYQTPAVTKRGKSLRLATHPTDCVRRKNYKRAMLKSIAAQAGRGGKSALQKWREKRRSARPNVTYTC